VGPRSSRVLVGVATLVALGALAAPAPAGAALIDVSATFSAFDPPDLEVLAGDSVKWSNVSTRTHTVTADDGSSFSSPRLEPGDTFSHDFATLGVFPYHCTIHPSIRGTVAVEQLILSGPTAPVDPGSAVTLRGRAQPGTASVTIERDAGGGYTPVATVTPSAGGDFAAQLTADHTASYRAVAAGAASPPARVLVLEQSQIETDVNTHQKDRTIVHVRVLPFRPGQLVVIQLHLRERFGWWPEGRQRLNRRSRARFRVPPSRAKARIVLTLNDGATVLAAGKPFKLR
jgi:plastocyanin